MNLKEWQEVQINVLKSEIKSELNDGETVSEHYFFSSDELKEIEEEWEVENFEEIIENFHELDLLEHEDLEPWDEELQEVYSFNPIETGSVMTIEAELDLSITEMNMLNLMKIKDVLFAEEFEVLVSEDKKKAKVFFKRAKGEISKHKKCGPGMKLKGNRCIPQGGSQKSKERVKGIKLKRAFKAIGTGKKKKAATKAKITKRRVNNRSRNYAGIGGK